MWLTLKKLRTESEVIDGRIHVKDPIYKRPYVLPEYMTSFFETKEMQRMKDIKQNGYSYIDIPSLKENKRWGHSIGVAHSYDLLSKKLISLLEAHGIDVDLEEVELAGLVTAGHDIGHIYNSHHSEDVIKYSHERRTSDILLGDKGDTEASQYLRKNYNKDKIARVVSVIVDEDNDQKLSPFLQLWKQALSSGFDLDKMDYVPRDLKYAGINIDINQPEMIQSLKVDIDEQGDYCLIIPAKTQRQLESIAIGRFWDYRDVCFPPSAEIMRVLEPKILDMAQEEGEDVKSELSDVFQKIMQAKQSDKRITTLQDDLQMTDTPSEIAITKLSKIAKDPILRYMCNIEQNI